MILYGLMTVPDGEIDIFSPSISFRGPVQTARLGIQFGSMVGYDAQSVNNEFTQVIGVA